MRPYFLALSVLCTNLGSVLAKPVISVFPVVSISKSTATEQRRSAAVVTAPAAVIPPPAPAVPQGAAKGFSIDYDPVIIGGCRNGDADFAVLSAQGAGFVRVYDIGCNLQQYVTAAATHNLKLMIGLNAIATLNKDLTTLIGMVKSSPAQWGPIDTVYIGNELVNSKITDPLTVSQAVTTARGQLAASGFTGNVVCIDTFNQMMTSSVLGSTSSYIAVNAHAFFDPNANAAGAGAFVRSALNQVAVTYPGRRIAITETGWPWQGTANGQAVPSLANQRTAIASIQQEFATTPADIYLFQAFDANYKPGGQFGIEPFFGLFDGDHFNGAL